MGSSVSGNGCGRLIWAIEVPQLLGFDFGLLVTFCLHSTRASPELRRCLSCPGGHFLRGGQGQDKIATVLLLLLLQCCYWSRAPRYRETRYFGV